ncbi:MAG TPA: alpha-galactosidase [Phototrophicaceae bacterium]|nr:alpha-galactosidase [Phototrophicaceae bacterium]
MTLMTLYENGLHIALDVTDEGDARLLHFGAQPFNPALIDAAKQAQWCRLVELQVTGEDQDDHHGIKHTGTLPAKRLRCVETRAETTDASKQIEIELHDPVLNLKVVCHWQFYDGLPVIRAWTTVENQGDQAVGLEYVSSFALTGLAKEGAQSWDAKMRLNVLHNAWEGEVQWRTNTLPELGLSRVHTFSLKRIAYSSTSPWSTSQFVPLACLENTETNTALIWQIEHNGAWHWEISDIREQLYLQLSGPTEAENQWWKRLQPGELFTSVPVAVGCVSGDFHDALRMLTQYRRRIFTRGDDLRHLPIIFNDYMNCLFGDPTTEKELPLIEAAAALGCEIFVIDAGWYADDGTWWDQVGDWQESKQRFPNGFREVIDAIHAKGMIPGIWLEIEVIGVNHPRAHELPDSWFFMRHGKRVIDHGRYQLDFRSPEVVAFANATIDRLMQTYGFGYLKIDYNINAGIGTETDADSFGDGLLEHNRAYLRWLDDLLARYPDLLIENCASGGMRMDYAMLSRLAVQSISDQTDYRNFAVIAASAPSAVTPEQSASWSYPLPEQDSAAVTFNMVNALLARVQQSGQVTQLSPEALALVRQGLDYYKTIRTDIPASLPYWPLGLPTFTSAWTSLALCCGNRTYLSIWRLSGAENTVTLPLPYLRGLDVTVAAGFPAQPNARWTWKAANGSLDVTLPQQFSACLLELTCGETDS